MEGSDEASFIPLNLDALELDNKADNTLSRITKNRIRNEITENYLYVQKQFGEIDSQYPKSFNAIASQVKSLNRSHLL